MIVASHLRASSWRPTAAPLTQGAFPPPGRSRGRQAVRCFASNDDGTVSVSLQVPYHCKYGQKVCVIGAADYLGAWNVENAVPMNWTEGDVWVVDLKLPAHGEGAEVEYKYVVRSERDMQAVRWQDGYNSQIRLPAHGQRLRVRDCWEDGYREVEVVEVEQPAQQYEAPPSPPPPPVVEPPPPAAPAMAAWVDAPAPPPPPPPPPMQEPQPRPPVFATAPAVTAAAEPSPQRRTRRKKVDEDEEIASAISKAADKAMQQLDSAVTRSFDLLTVTEDPAAPELLAADRLLAAAARRAATMNKALDAAKDAKLLPPAKPANGNSGGQRRRRSASRKKDGSS